VENGGKCTCGKGALQQKIHCGKGALWKKPHCGKVKNMRKKFGMQV
jgi:hypothetical protein